VKELLSPASIAECGLFKPAAVSQLVSKLTLGERVGETDDMALAGILSTQLLFQQFIRNFHPSAPLGIGDKIRVCRRGVGNPAFSHAL
jgi:asparagine synthase (glutamine-hydrolysing)